MRKMTLNKTKGEMYSWIDETRNFIGGECPHQCLYCFVKNLKFPLVKERYSGELKLLKDEFEKPLGKGKTIFVCDCIDMFADKIPKEWIIKTLEYCRNYSKNTYLFQTKNPKRFFEFFGQFPPKTILGITLETNKYNPSNISDAPSPEARVRNFSKIKDYDKMVSIEPILNFNLDVMVKWIKEIKPKFVSIGADSKKSNLVEPSKEKVELLIKELKKFTQVKVKDNLRRLI